MSKYFVFGGIVWIFVSLFIGVSIVLSPNPVKKATDQSEVKVPIDIDKPLNKSKGDNIPVVVKTNIDGTVAEDGVLSKVEIKR